MRKKKRGKITKKSKLKFVNERVSSGVSGFNALIGGGFEKNSVNLVIGGAGSTKTIFSMHFLIEGIKNGERVLYITFEEKREEFYKNMMNFGWDLESLERDGKFIFLEYNPEKVRLMLEEGGGSVETIVSKNKISRLVIDSVTSFALLFKEELERREAALSLFDIIRKWNCTSLLTLQEEPTKRTESSSNSLEFEADGIIFLYFVRYKDRRQRFIEVLKMRGTKHSTEIHSFEVNNSGIHIAGKISKEHFAV